MQCCERLLRQAPLAQDHGLQLGLGPSRLVARGVGGGAGLVRRPAGGAEAGEGSPVGGERGLQVDARVGQVLCRPGGEE